MRTNEPIAWMYSTVDLVCIHGRTVSHLSLARQEVAKGWAETPLYTHPANDAMIAAMRELAHLRAGINTPLTGDFIKAANIEATHQRERWGAEHDTISTAAALANWQLAISGLDTSMRPGIAALKPQTEKDEDMSEDKVGKYCSTCRGFGYLVTAPSTCSAGGDRLPCPVCQRSGTTIAAPMLPQAGGRDDVEAVARSLANHERSEHGLLPLSWEDFTSPEKIKYRARAISAIAAMPSNQGEAKPVVAGLVEALKVASDAINEMFRYYDGGETRGSYDGRPERDQLRKAGYVVKAALARASEQVS